MTLKSRMKDSGVLTGTWVKTPDPNVCEVLGDCDLDMICLDAEHAPFGRRELDLCLSALRSRDKDVLVRVADDRPSAIQTALDGGATGIIIPHVVSAAQAAAVVRASYYGRCGRGFAGTTRAGEFGRRSMQDHVNLSNNTTVVTAQIEDPEALSEINEIAAIPGLDALFIGRMDLTLALGAATPDDPIVMDAALKVCAAGKEHGKAVGMFTPDMSEIQFWIDQGCRFFILGSDHAFLRHGANGLHRDIMEASSTKLEAAGSNR